MEKQLGSLERLIESIESLNAKFDTLASLMRGTPAKTSSNTTEDDSEEEPVAKNTAAKNTAAKKPAAKKPAAKKPVDTSEDDEDDGEDDEDDGDSLETQCHVALTKVKDVLGLPAARSLMGKYGYKKMVDIKPEHHSKILKEALAKIASAETEDDDDEDDDM